MNSTVLAFDFGIKSIGVAVGQCVVGTACPLNALKAKNGIPNWYLIEHLIKEWLPSEVIVGLPLNIDGTEQPFTTRARKFANRIYERFNIEVKLHDERLSTIEARHELFEHEGFSALNKKSKIDSTSAAIILKSYCNSKSCFLSNFL